MDPNKHIFRYSELSHTSDEKIRIQSIKRRGPNAIVQYDSPIPRFEKDERVEIITNIQKYNGCHNVKSVYRDGLGKHYIILKTSYLGIDMSGGFVTKGCKTSVPDVSIEVGYRPDTGPIDTGPNSQGPNGQGANGEGPNGEGPVDKITQFVKKNKIPVVAGILLLIALIWYLRRR